MNIPKFMEQQNRKGPGSRTDGTLVPLQGSRANPQLVLCLLADVAPASRRGQGDTGHSKEIFTGWSHCLARKDQNRGAWCGEEEEWDVAEVYKITLN